MAAAALLVLAIGGVAALLWSGAIQFRGDDGARCLQPFASLGTVSAQGY